MTSSSTKNCIHLHSALHRDTFLYILVTGCMAIGRWLAPGVEYLLTNIQIQKSNMIAYTSTRTEDTCLITSPKGNLLKIRFRNQNCKMDEKSFEKIYNAVRMLIKDQKIQATKILELKRRKLTRMKSSVKQ
jgi:hypothetical protein